MTSCLLNQFRRCSVRSLVVVALACVGGVTQAADALVSSGVPNVLFDDSDNNPGVGVEWKLGTINEGEHFRISDLTSVVERSVFRIFKGCSADTLRLNPDLSGLGMVGVGASPSFPLHVFRAGDTATYLAGFQQSRPNRPVGLLIENTAAVSANNSTGIEFRVRDAATPKLCGRILSSLPVTTSNAGTGQLQFQVREKNAVVTAMSIRGSRVSIGTPASTHILRVINANCNGSTWNNGCSRDLKQEIAPLTDEAARTALASLAPVTYAYKDEPTDARVGFIAEDAPELVAMPDRQSLCAMDIVAVLTKVAQDQEREITQLRGALAEQQQSAEAQQRAMLERLAALEARLDACGK